jgi:hypothetical protein
LQSADQEGSLLRLAWLEIVAVPEAIFRGPLNLFFALA